ncbi:Homeobox domain [Trinorchestia longiramus]|nr:Homeobox domain [Trinorchestia longiramus]
MATDHPSRAADHPSRDSDHPSRVADHPSRAADHPSRAADHPSRAADHPSRATVETTYMSRVHEQDFNESSISFSINRILKPEFSNAGQASSKNIFSTKPAPEMQLSHTFLSNTSPVFHPSAYLRPLVLPFPRPQDLPSNEGHFESQSWSAISHSRSFSPLLGGMLSPMLGVCGGIYRPVPLVRPPPCSEEFFLRTRMGDTQINARHLPQVPPLLPTVQYHHYCPRYSTTIIANCPVPPLLPQVLTVQYHHYCPRYSTTIIANCPVPPLLPQVLTVQYHQCCQLSSTTITAAGTDGAVPPQRRKKSWSRAVFTGLQRKGLELSFAQQKYITKPDRKQLASSLGLTDAQVKVWFQNRRMKWRQEQTHPEGIIHSKDHPPEGTEVVSEGETECRDTT